MILKEDFVIELKICKPFRLKEKYKYLFKFNCKIPKEKVIFV
jgi:hypothetical protein